MRRSTAVLGLLAGMAIAPCPPVRAQSAADDPPAAQTGDATAFIVLGEQRPFQAEVITEVYQDRTGFLWIGTREGLFLHDGQRFRKFQHDVGDPRSLSSNGIRGVLEDSGGRLWVHTLSGGLNLVDRVGWTFRHFNHTGEPGGLSHDGVFALAEAADGGLWVGTQAGLDLLDPDSGRARPRPLTGKGGEFVMTLLAGGDGRLWVGTLGQGLFRETGNGGFEPVGMVDPGLQSPTDIFSLARDATGTVWVGARDGLYRIDPDAQGLARQVSAPATPGDGLLNVTSLIPDGNGVLWIGTFGIGLYRLDTRSGRLETVDLGRTGSGARHIDQGSMLVDRQGGLIVGTFGAGLLRRPPPMLDTHSYRIDPEAAGGLRGEDVYSLLADGDDLLIGSFGGGVQRLDDGSGRIEWLDSLETGDGRHLDGVVALLRARDGALWVGTSAGLYRRDGGGVEQQFVAPPGSPGEANPGYVYALLEDRAGRIWVGSGGAGLYRYRPDNADPGAGDFLVYRPEPGNSRSLSDDFVSALMEDRHGRLWIGTRSGGLNLCEADGERLDCERMSSGVEGRAPSHHHIADLLEAPDGAVWIGTGGGGLNRIEVDDEGRLGETRIWTRADGLVDDNVMALAHAPDGALWISTRVGLSRLGPEGRFDNYTVADGLPTAVFNAKAVAWLGGRLYLGATRGVVSIDPVAWQRPGPPPPTVLTSIEGLEKTAVLDAPSWALSSLKVPWRQPFSLEFSVLSYDGGEAEYEYRLNDADAWTPLGNRSQLTLHLLPPRNYRVGIRGRRGGAAWIESTPLAIEVVPPWWRNPWLQMGLIVVAFGLVVLAALWRVRALEARNAELQALQWQKDVALQEARDSRDRLETAFSRLRRLTMQLEAAKEEERKHIARELHDEFGQALTAAKINLRLALSSAARDAAEGRIDDTLQLVERLIVQVRALSLDLRPPLLDELGLVPAMEGYLVAVSERSGVPVRCEIEPGLPMADPERAIAVFRIVQEAVTNALRHAGADELRVGLRRADDGVEGIVIEVADDGHGFDTVAALAGTGKGFGLFGMGERVRDLGGRFNLDSGPGRGTVVRAVIPVTAATDREGEQEPT